MEKAILWSSFLMLSAVILMWTGLEKEYKKRKMYKKQQQYQREAVLGRRASRIERYVTNEKNLVRTTATERNTYLALLGASIAGGWLFGKLVFMDTAISLFVAGICVVLPHVALVLKQNRKNRERAENLESAMRIITHEYLATLDIQKAVENAVDVINHDKPFREFLVDCKMVSSDMERNLRRLESKERNMYFSRWIDQLILVQTDRTQIFNLTPILDDMNDAKTSQRMNDTKVAGAWREYFTILAIVLLFPLLIRIMQYEWYMYLVGTAGGKVLVVMMLMCLVWATGRAISINKPITG